MPWSWWMTMDPHLVLYAAMVISTWIFSSVATVSLWPWHLWALLIAALSGERWFCSGLTLLASGRVVNMMPTLRAVLFSEIECLLLNQRMIINVYIPCSFTSYVLKYAFLLLTFYTVLWTTSNNKGRLIAVQMYSKSQVIFYCQKKNHTFSKQVFKSCSI